MVHPCYFHVPCDPLTLQHSLSEHFVNQLWSDNMANLTSLDQETDLGWIYLSKHRSPMKPSHTF